MGNNYNIRIEGSKIRHTMGCVSIKMYDKFGQILRIETTVNNISFFKHYRTVEHRDGKPEEKLAPLKKNIYSLNILQEHLKASNQRYLGFISTIEDSKVGKNNLQKLSRSEVQTGRSYKGFNIFDERDYNILNTILRGEFNISGFRNKNIKPYIPGKSSSQISRVLKRLNLHGLIRKVGKTYKYYVTEFGRQVIITCLKLKNLVIIPSLNFVKA